MRTSAVSGTPCPDHAENTPLLALGYHGTLQADPACQTSVTIPPQFTALLDSLLATARAQLNHLLTPTQKVLSGEPIPITSLLQNLRQRLQDILTLPLATLLVAENIPPHLPAARLTREYPVLASLLHQSISEFVTCTITFIHRLQSDSYRMAQWLGLATLPSIESLTTTTCDTHPGGHLVLRIAFRGGICLYYKPRPVTGEWLWRKLIESVTDVDPNLQIPSARVLPGRYPYRYGWMESVLPYPTPHNTPVSPRYWQAAGAVLCLAHHVRLTDLHLGNILATPTGPAVVDAECLASPTLSQAGASKSVPQGDSIADLLQSFVSTGLLPASNRNNTPDVSGLFANGGSVPDIRLPQWSRQPDGGFRLVSVPAILLDHGNTPQSTSPLAVLPQLLAGYRQAATALMEARNSLLAPDSPWLKTLHQAHAPRVLLRDTLPYALLLTQSLHPSHLRSAARCRTALRIALGEPLDPQIPQSVLRTELRSLLHLHIPRLTLLPGSRTLAAGSGRPLAAGFATESPAAQVIRAFQALTPSSLEAAHIPALLLALLPSLG